MKFAMFSDLHYDAIPDGNRRIEDFLDFAEKAEAEFNNDLLIIKLPKADLVQGHKLKL